MNEKNPVTNPVQWLWRACVLILGCTIVLNLAVSFLRPILPWLIGGVTLVIVTWVAVVIIRWRQSRW